MSTTLHLNLPDDLRQCIAQAAATLGQTPEEWVVAMLRQRFGQPDMRFRRHFGEISLGHPTGMDNDAIDRDLAKAYADTHEEV